MIKRIAVFMLLMLILAGCVSLGGQKGSTPFMDTKWRPVEFFGNPLEPAAGGPQEPFIIFQKADLRIIGHGGCNRFSGSFTSTPEGNLSIGPLMATKMACPDMHGEMLFHQALGTAVSFETGPGTLVMKDEAGTVIARFIEAAENKAP